MEGYNADPTDNVATDFIDWRERRYFGRNTTEVVGLSLLGNDGTTPIDADGAVTFTFSLENPDGTLTQIFQRTATHTAVGLYEVALNAADTDAIGNYRGVWSYTLSAVAETYTVYAAVGESNPAYDQLPAAFKEVVDQVWIRFADLFDSPSGGPHLQTYYQTHWSRGRMAQLMGMGLRRLNVISQPHMTYTINGVGGQVFPLAEWGGLLEQACVVPETPVLRADLRWVPAGNLMPGDRVVAFDEELSGSKFRTATVIHNVPGPKDCYEVVTSEGTVTATYDHKWVVRNHRGNRVWVETKDLDPQKHVILSIGAPEQRDLYDTGYVAGLYDGEGCLTFTPNARTDNPNCRLIFSQKPGLVMDEVERILKEREYKVGQQVRSGSALNLNLGGGMLGIIRFLAEFRPKRLLEHSRLSELWDNRSMRSVTFRSARVLSVTPVGPQIVSGIETTTGTFIANGLLSHNTYIEALKHLRRSYLEQPQVVLGGSVSRLDRTSYWQQWGTLLADEERDLKSSQDTYKIAHMFLGTPKVLVSGGVYGRYGPTRIAGSVAARPRYWTRFYA